MQIVPIATLLLAACACLFSLLALLRRSPAITGEDLEKVRQDMLGEIRQTRVELNQTIQRETEASTEQLLDQLSRLCGQQDKHLKEGLQHFAHQQYQLQQSLNGQLSILNQQMQGMAAQNEQKLENVRKTMETRISAMQTDNNRQLTEMRQTVDEKLQQTLDEKLKQSFSLVSERLETVYKGLGEMQTLAAGVGDLKKVLSNVKTRGILGEVQLGAILEQVLTREQYAENIATVPGSSERVEFALQLPGDGQTPIWLPIDAKFPIDAYNAVLDAYDKGDNAAVEAAAKALEARVRSFARDIHNKYIAPPFTTDFGIMFLPIEGLYAEVVRRGVSDRIQREFRVIVAGPTTMAALLNSLQMGFRTLAIQKRSGEVWAVLGNVKAEFDTFGAALAQAQNRLNQASSELENLVGVRTRQIQRKLQHVSSLSELPQTNEAADNIN